MVVKKIIWADDKKGIFAIMMPRLEKSCEEVGIEIQVDKVFNGISLVEKVLNGDYDLVITDYQMPTDDGTPEIDGLQAIAQIRAQNETIPIYILTSDDNIEGRALEAGATGYIDKFDSKDKMFRKVAEHLDKL